MSTGAATPFLRAAPHRNRSQAGFFNIKRSELKGAQGEAGDAAPAGCITKLPHPCSAMLAATPTSSRPTRRGAHSWTTSRFTPSTARQRRTRGGSAATACASSAATGACGQQAPSLGLGAGWLAGAGIGVCGRSGGVSKQARQAARLEHRSWCKRPAGLGGQGHGQGHRQGHV